MNSKYQWVENKYQPGLFTFYLEQESLTSTIKKTERKSDRNHFNKSIFQSQRQNIKKQRYSERYNGINTSRYHQSNRKIKDQFNCKPKIGKIGKNDNKLIISAINFQTEKGNQSVNEGRDHLLRKTYINKYFHYDINKSKSKMFVYRGQPFHFTKKFSKKHQKQPQSGEINTKTSSEFFNKSRMKTECTDNSKQSINSDENIIQKAKQKLNFLQFLIQRNNHQKMIKSESHKKRIQMTLLKLKKFNLPKMLQIPLKLITQKQ